jgi:hypothetical protein
VRLLKVWSSLQGFASQTVANFLLTGGTVALYAQLCRTMGFSPFGTLRQQDHQQVLNMKSGEEGGCMAQPAARMALATMPMSRIAGFPLKEPPEIAHARLRSRLLHAMLRHACCQELVPHAKK